MLWAKLKIQNQPCLWMSTFA